MGLILFESMIIGTVVIGDEVQGALPPVEDEEFEDELDDEPDEEELEVVVGVQLVDEMVSVVVETVPPNASALPVHVTVLPMVIPEASMSVPANVVFAPSVVAAFGDQNTSHADAPPASVTAELATVVSAPFIRKMYVPLPVSVIPPVPMEAALEAEVQ